MNRRTLSAALQTPDLSEAAFDFVKGNPAKPASEPMPLVANPAPMAQVRESPLSPNGLKSPLPTTGNEPEAGLVSLTVRVPRGVPPGLLLASVDRKLKRQRPWTQQEIVAEALTDWLKEHGYLSGAA